MTVEPGALPTQSPLAVTACVPATKTMDVGASLAML
jgi:hypothetical protein